MIYLKMMSNNFSKPETIPDRITPLNFSFFNITVICKITGYEKEVPVYKEYIYVCDFWNCLGKVC